MLARATSRVRARATRALSSYQSIFDPTEDHRALRELVRTFAREEVEPQAESYNAAEKLNRSLLTRMGELGLHGVTVSEEYGGVGLDATAFTIVHEELAYSDAGLCLAYLAHSALHVNNIYHNASDEQKKLWLPSVLSGEHIGGMCMSEPGAGTDVLGLTTRAEKQPDGSYVLTGNKMWITNGCLDDTTLGDAFLVYARTGERRQDLSLLRVEKGMPGFSLGQRIKGKLGMRSSTTAELVFDKVPVPAANLVGPEHKATLAMMRNLEIERVVLAAMSLGMARRCIDVMRTYTQERHAFGKPLTQYGQIQRHVADSYAQYCAGRAYVYELAARMDLGAPGQRLDSDGVKLFCSTMAKNVADSAVQALGGYGYVSEYVVERMWRDAKLIEIGGGTIEAHQKNMMSDLAKLDTLP